MQILFLDPLLTILLDINAWLVVHLSLGFISSKLPLDWLNPDQRFFRTFSWEKDGEIYQKIFPYPFMETLYPRWFETLSGCIFNSESAHL